MPTSNILKQNAKANLKDKWPEAIAITGILLTLYAVNIVVNEVAFNVFSAIVNEFSTTLIIIGLSLLFGQFFIAPLLYGVLRWFWFSSENTKVPLNEIFCYFSDLKMYLRAFSLSFRIFLRIIFVLLVCFFPAFIVIIISSPTTYELLGSSMPHWATYIWLLGNVLSIFGLIMSFIMLLRYFAAPILMINDSRITPQEALHLSVIISKTSNGQTFYFILSFAGWFVLSLLLIPLFFTVPYFFASYCEYCRYLIKNYNSAINPS